MKNLHLESNEEIKTKVKYIESINTGTEQRAQLVLVLLGAKPAAELSIYPWNSTPEETEELLKQTQLEFVKNTDKDEGAVAEYAISKDKKLIEKLLDNPSHSEYGRLMGYPETAIEAFESGDRYEGPLPEDIENSIFKLAFSKKHYNEEFEVVRKWNRLLEEYSPEISNG